MTHDPIRKAAMNLRMIIPVVIMILIAASIPALSSASSKKSSGRRAIAGSITAKGKKSSRHDAPNTFASPDFAFPTDVSANARQAIRDASAAHDYINMIRGAEQLVIASSEISDSTAPRSAALLDSLAAVCPSPYSSMLRLLEAKLYSEIYQSSYIFNTRNLPLDSFPADIQSWSGELFRLRILALTKEASEGFDSLLTTPIASVMPLLVPAGGDVPMSAATPSVADFIAEEANALLGNYTSSERIPFGPVAKPSISESISGFLDSLDDRCIGWHREHGSSQAEMTALLRKASRMAGWQRAATLLEAIDSFGSSAASIRLVPPLYSLADFKNGVAEYEEAAGSPEASDAYLSSLPHGEILSSASRFHAFAISQLNAHPDTVGSGAVRNVIRELTVPSIRIATRTQFLSSEKISLSLDIANLKSAKLLVLSIPAASSSAQLYKLLQQSKVERTLPVENLPEEMPFTRNMKISLDPLPVGYYLVVPSADGTVGGIPAEFKDNWLDALFIVSDLTVAETRDRIKGDANVLYVAEAKNQKPVAGASVVFTRPGRGTTVRLVSDSEGRVEVPEGYYDAKVSRGADVIFTSTSRYLSSEKESERFNASIYTDLSIYKPGQKVGFAAILSSVNGKKARVAGGRTLKISLLDASRNVADTLSLTTDDYGRVNGSFTLPDSGLLGSWSISATTRRDKKDLYVGTAYFQVAEYKAPTFYVKIESPEGETAPGDTVRFRGQALTYSGMPVADAPVSFTVQYRRPWFWYRSTFSPANASYGGNTVSSADGTFEIVLPTAPLQGTPFGTGTFSLTATVSDQAGESQTSPSVRFSLGKGTSLVASVPQTVEAAGEELTLRVQASDIAGTPVSRKIDYMLCNELSGEKSYGSFMSPDLKLKTDRLPSGPYSVEFAIAGDTVVSARSSFTLWRRNDKTAPEQTPLWMPQTAITAEKGAREVKVPLGSAYPDSWLLCSASTPEGSLWQKWVRNDGRMSTISVPAPAADSRVWLSVSGTHDARNVVRTVEISPWESTAAISVEAESFRDRITPGAEERWSFRFVPSGAAARRRVAAMAVMSDKALDAIAPFRWSSPSPYIGFSPVSGLTALGSGPSSSLFRYSTGAAYTDISFPVPRFDTYGMALYDAPREQVYYMLCDSAPVARSSGAVRVKGSAKMAVVNEMKTEAAVADAVAEAPEEEAGDGGAPGGKDVNDLPLRDSEHPLAFFRPSLMSDEDGSLTISFEVPNFNTTWALQLLGYTPDMLSALGNFESVASKPVMVSANAPRFLRTGDTTRLLATVFNNTDSAADASACIEVFDPMTDAILARKDFSGIGLASRESSIVGLDFTAPDNLNCIGMRVYASAGSYRDGEQTVIAVLPSSAPVVESVPFYLGPGRNDYTVRLPKLDKSATATLTYCDNPVWTCLTALPDITVSPSACATSKLSALYGTALASHIVAKMPGAKDAIRTWLSNPADSVLVSPLAKNPELKILALSETPWTGNAASESLRMLRLGHLLDTRQNDSSIASLMKEILDLQRPDGGFAWTPGMESSDWVTSRMLLYFGMMKGTGCLPIPDKALPAIDKAIGYADRSLIRYIRESKPSFPLHYALNYFYVRSFFDKGSSSDVRSALARTLKLTEEQWRDFDIYDKATAAILLHRNGQTGVASTILRSLSQFASRSEGKGVWFDNLSSGYNGFSRLITTTQVLEAFAEISPKAPEVDGLRQWLILSRQVEDWGSTPYTAEIVNAVLTSGSDWTISSAPARFMLGGKELEAPAGSALIGETVIDLDAAEASGEELRIIKDGSHPSWGGVITRSILPVKDVKAASTEDIKVSKEIFTVADSADGTLLEKESLATGRRVRVVITVTTTRDLDYVALTDQRPACLEPKDQLSGYTASDGLFYYREVRQTSTNFFFGFLPKGTWHISYDCYADRSGEYADGIAAAQSQYAPTITAHSGGRLLKVAASSDNYKF